MFGANKGSNTFGSNTTATGFGTGNQQQPGFKTATNQQTTGFGTNNNQSNSVFGNTQTASSGFGASQPSAGFGSSGFGSSGFGTSNQPTSGTSSSLFGSNNQPSTSSGGSLFGSTKQPTTSTGGSVFGTTNQPGTSSGGGIFGASNSAAVSAGGGLFGSTNQPTTSTGGGIFGSTNQPTTSTGGGLFGSTNQPTTSTGGGLFGSTNQPVTSSGAGMFGNVASTSSLFGATSSGTGFGATGKTSTGLFGATTQSGGGFGTGMFGASQPATGFGLGSTNLFNGDSHPPVQLPLFSIDEQDPWGNFSHLTPLSLPPNSTATQSQANGAQSTLGASALPASSGVFNGTSLRMAASNQVDSPEPVPAPIPSGKNVLKPVGSLELTESFSLRPTDEVINQYFTNPELLTQSHIFFKSVNFLDAGFPDPRGPEPQLSLEEVEEQAQEFEQLPLQMYPPFNRIRRRGLGSNSKVFRITVQHPRFGKCTLLSEIEAAAFSLTTEADFLHQFQFALASFDYTPNQWAQQYVSEDASLEVSLNYVAYVENQDSSFPSYSAWLESLENTAGTEFISYDSTTLVWRFTYHIDPIV